MRAKSSQQSAMHGGGHRGHLVMWAGESSRVVRSSGICHWTTAWSLSILVLCLRPSAWQQAVGQLLGGRAGEQLLGEVLDEVVEAQPSSAGSHDFGDL